MSRTYKIVRFFEDRPHRNRVVKDMGGLSLDEAMAHCSRPESSSRTATDPSSRDFTRRHGTWFDGYTEES